MTSHRFEGDPPSLSPLAAPRKILRPTPPLSQRRSKDVSPRHPKSKAGSHLIGSHVSPRLLKMQSLDQLPPCIPSQVETTPECPIPTQGSILSPSSEMTSAGSSGFDPSCGSYEGMAACSPRYNSGSILKQSSNIKGETQKKVAFLPMEESEDELPPIHDDLETAVILRKSDTHRKKKAKPARRSIMSYHSNCS